MKILFMIVLLAVSEISFSQTQEVKQLLLDVEKLAQFKQILSDMKKGYEILHGGYTAIKNISQGNFKLHQVFLDGLLQVSPTVQRYERITDIIQLQLRLVREYRTAYNQFRSDGRFTIDEIDYMGKVYSHLFNESVQNLDDLVTVITAGKLRMNDDERLKAIDHIWDEVQNQYAFLRDFNGSTSMLSMARAKEQEEVDVMRRLTGSR
jgi:hypothetical protein